MAHDVYLYGMISPSTVYVLREDFAFPKPNGYAEVGRVLPSIGGEAATRQSCWLSSVCVPSSTATGSTHGTRRR